MAKRKLLAVLLVLSVGAVHQGRAQSFLTGDETLPNDGVVNIKTQYGAKGDGRTDDTYAIQRAIQENLTKALYLPNGIYLVSNRLDGKNTQGAWTGGMRIYGQNQYNTIIRLKDNAAGYANAAAPRAVISTNSYQFSQGSGRDHLGLGEGNEAYRNYLENLTVETGSGNRGAIGIDYLANNTGAIRNVTIRGGGETGLSMMRKWPGPCLISNLTVVGFNYGIRVQHPEYGITFEHLTLSQQVTAGIRNDGNVLSIRKLKSTNSVPAIMSTNNLGLITIVEGEFSGGSSLVSAIDNRGSLFARNVVTSGYRSAITNNGTAVVGMNVTEYVSHPVQGPSGVAGKSLGLEVRNTPDYKDNAPENWANVLQYGAKRDDWENDLTGIQAAINSGKPVIYFPPGNYLASGTIVVKSTVRKIIGFGITLAPTWAAFPDANNPKPLFRIEGGSGEPIIIENMSMGKLHDRSPQPGLIGCENTSSRPLVLKDITTSEHKYLYRTLPGAGPLFMENICSEKSYFGPGQEVWARQLNPEGANVKVINDGGKLWILGIKTEGHNTVIETKKGGQTELLGGLLYPAMGQVPTGDVAFTSSDSRVSLTFATSAYSSFDHDYQKYVTDTQGTLAKASAVRRGGAYGGIIALYSNSRASAPIVVVEEEAEAEIHSGLLYELEPKCAPGMRLDVRGGANRDGTEVQLWERTWGVAQAWQFSDEEDDHADLTPQCAPGGRLDVSSSGRTDGTKVQLWHQNRTDAQRWKLIDAGDGYYELAPRHAPDMRLDVNASGRTNGTKVHLWKRNGTDAQRWRLVLKGNARIAAEPASREPSAEAGLRQNYPNPFSDETIIPFSLPEGARQASVCIYSVQGQLVKQIAVGAKNQGSVTVNAGEFAPGLYIYRLTVDGRAMGSQRMVRQK
ncbi:MAG: RICIN domain-containing protein [Ferruginibacter sp.]|nr:RICIN domain-containing protein [Cytophagales bacterium]